MTPLQPVKVTIIGGFLGSGKTTLLNHVLQSDTLGGRSVGVLVNDFGSINIDAKLVVGIDNDMIDLSNGCVCCSLRSDFVAALQRLSARDNPPDHIIIEASGVSDPAAIANGLEEPSVAGLAQLDAVLVVIDAEHHLRLRFSDHIVAAGQVRGADVVVVNKVDLVSSKEREAVTTSIQRIVPKARIYPTSFGQIGPELFFGDVGERPEVTSKLHVSVREARSLPMAQLPVGHVRTEQGEVRPEFDTWRFVSDQPLSSRRLRRVMQRLPSQIYRAKGVVRLLRDQGRRAVLHVVGRRAELQLGAPWGSDAPRSELVFIGARGSLNPADLRTQLEACIHDDGEPGVFGWFRRMWDFAL